MPKFRVLLNYDRNLPGDLSTKTYKCCLENLLRILYGCLRRILAFFWLSTAYHLLFCPLSFHLQGRITLKCPTRLWYLSSFSHLNRFSMINELSLSRLKLMYYDSVEIKHISKFKAKFSSSSMIPLISDKLFLKNSFAKH